MNTPTTSQLSESPSLRSKLSHNSTNKANTAQNLNTMFVPISDPQRQNQNSTVLFNNSAIDNCLLGQCSDSNISKDDDSNTSTPKRKNALKKERFKKEGLKKLQLQIPPQAQNPAQTIQTAPVNSGMSMMHEFFSKQISPLYVNTNSRYLENSSHNPHFQLMQTLFFRDMCQYNSFPASVPGTPLSQTHNSNFRGYPHPATVSQNQYIPKYLQNVYHHPFLSQNHVNVNHRNFNQNHRHHPSKHNILSSPVNKSNNSPSQQRKRNKQDQHDVKNFDPYVTAEEVEIGLRNNSLLEGVLRINPKQSNHAYVSSTDRNEQDVFIDGIKNRNRALEGDVVIIQYIDSDTEANKDNIQRKGKVVYIKEKIHNRTCIGVLKLMSDKNRQKALFVPRDYRLPRVNISFTNWPDNFYDDAKSYENTLFLVKIFDWFDVRFALGNIVRNIGESGDMRTETLAILAQTGLDITPYGSDVRHLYPRLDYSISDQEKELREDCQKLCIFSIDPSNCRDIDDAVSCKKLENGNYEIGVHISDVAHFLAEDTLLDEKVAEKATTIYMVEKAYHMLPDELCMLCSLFPGVEKLAFSVFWEITEEAEIISHRFSKTVINSCCQLSYDHAQRLLENNSHNEESFPEIYNGFSYQDIKKAVHILGKISAIFRKQRFDNGALSIHQTKLSFHLNPANGLPDSYHIYESKESHQLIEEFMLLANMTVAKRIHDDHPKLAFLRCHPPPSSYMLKELAKSLQPIGIDIQISSAGDFYNSLLPYVGPDNEDVGRAMVLNMLCAKPMARAKYFCAAGLDSDDEFHHYALNVPIYTHFTSPIRRYADIMVHRLLAASLNYRDIPNWEVDKVHMIAAQCNKQKYNAKKAGELSSELYTLKYIEMNSPVVTEAVVVDIREKNIDVIIVAMGLNRRIYFNSDFPGNHKCIKNDGGNKLSKMEVTWKKTDDNQVEVEQVIEIFSILKVEMYKDDDMMKVETKLVRPQ